MSCRDEWVQNAHRYLAHARRARTLYRDPALRAESVIFWLSLAAFARRTAASYPRG